MKLFVCLIFLLFCSYQSQAGCSCEFFFDENYLKWGRDTVTIDLWGYSRMDLNKQFIVDSVANLPDEQQICIIECLLEKSKVSDDITLLYHEYTTDKKKIMYQGSHPTRRPYPYRSVTSVCYYLISAIYYKNISYIHQITFPTKKHKQNVLKKANGIMYKIKRKIYRTKKDKK
ncbi:hypothetical protein [Hugenholtzia roseola]|uniref:hypothetical protein n=1 Tax=Hugenholtzia roseola TaxID=1002 RepID=UPI00047893AE|nr:hypothetical protein [Hugenholtzia roseola]